MSATVTSQEMVNWSVRAQGELEDMSSECARDEGCDEEECLLQTDTIEVGGQECPPHTGNDNGGGQECPAQVDEDGDLWLYRDRTVVLLKRYGRMSVETGRLPSLLGRECFRSRVTPYAMASFEDMAIFVHDIEKALRTLDDFQQQMIVLNVLEEFSQWDIARLLGRTKRWIEWQVPDAIDALSRILLASGLLTRMPDPKREAEACQEGTNDESLVSDSKEGENIF